MEGQQNFNESPINVCLKQGKKLKMMTRLKKESIEAGQLEFETDFQCADNNE